MKNKKAKRKNLSPICKDSDVGKLFFGFMDGKMGDDALEQLKEMKNRKDILNCCHIWQATDGRWKTKLPDQSAKGGYKLVAKTSREDLENFIVDFHKGQQESGKPCLRSIYDGWIAFKEKETSLANANKLSFVWKKYCEGSSIATVPFEDMSVGQMKDWLLNVISEKQLTERQHNELKSVLNMMYDYATSYNITPVNIPRQIRKPFEKVFKKAEEKPLGRIIYSEDAEKELIREALRQYEKTENTAYLAICLNFSLGLRVGELVALSSSCVHDDGTLDIVRTEIKGYWKDADGACHRSGYKVVNRAKTKCGIRNLCLTPKAMKYIQMAIERNRKLGISDGDYIFINKKGKRIHESDINKLLRKLNGAAVEKGAVDRPSGNHATRRTVLSRLHASLKLSDDTIKTFAGHKDISTTQKCYIHQVRPMAGYADKIADALDIS